MFGLFKRNPTVKSLYSEYKKLIEEWHKLSSINRSLSDQKLAKAQEVMGQIETLKQHHSYEIN